MDSLAVEEAEADFVKGLDHSLPAVLVEQHGSRERILDSVVHPFPKAASATIAAKADIGRKTAINADETKPGGPEEARKGKTLLS